MRRLYYQFGGHIESGYIVYFHYSISPFNLPYSPTPLLPQIYNKYSTGFDISSRGDEKRIATTAQVIRFSPVQ